MISKWTPLWNALQNHPLAHTWPQIFQLLLLETEILQAIHLHSSTPSIESTTEKARAVLENISLFQSIPKDQLFFLQS